MKEWIDVSRGLPTREFELCATGEYVSNVVLITDKNSGTYTLGFGHVSDEGVWTIYDGEHDFMNVQKVTHWMPLPEPPQD
jgi:hypothetical protein